VSPESPSLGCRSTHPWLSSHCSDVLSLANHTTLLGDVVPVVVSFIGYWVQTLSTSRYDYLVAKTMSPAWAKVHLPVISQHGHDNTRFTKYSGPEPPAVLLPPFPPRNDHVLYTEFSLAQPMGAASPCHLGCKSAIEIKQKDNFVRLICSRCRQAWRVPIYRSNDSTVLGASKLVAVPYPQPIHPTQIPAVPTQGKQNQGKQNQGKHNKAKYIKAVLSGLGYNPTRDGLILQQDTLLLP